MFDIHACVYSAAGVREFRSNVRVNNNVLFVACVISVHYYDRIYVRACVSVCVCVCINLGIGDLSRTAVIDSQIAYFRLEVTTFSYSCFISPISPTIVLYFPHTSSNTPDQLITHAAPALRESCLNGSLLRKKNK